MTYSSMCSSSSETATLCSQASIYEYLTISLSHHKDIIPSICTSQASMNLEKPITLSIFSQAKENLGEEDSAIIISIDEGEGNSAIVAIEAGSMEKNEVEAIDSAVTAGEKSVNEETHGTTITAIETGGKERYIDKGEADDGAIEGGAKEKSKDEGQANDGAIMAVEGGAKGKSMDKGVADVGATMAIGRAKGKSTDEGEVRDSTVMVIRSGGIVDKGTSAITAIETGAKGKSGNEREADIQVEQKQAMLL